MLFAGGPLSGASDSYRPRSSSGLPSITTTTTFSAPFPVPMSVDPFAALTSRPSSANADGLAGLWKGLATFRRFYAVPDAREWEELSKGGAAWSSGVDLLG